MKIVLIILGCVLMLAALGGVGYAVVKFDASLNDKQGKCAPRERSDLSIRKARWLLTRPKGNKKIVVSLDDYTNRARRGFAFVKVAPTGSNSTKPALPRGTRIGAFVRGGALTSDDRALSSVVARAIRERDGTLVRVVLCARRSEDRGESPPGRYVGTVRVAGPKVVPVDLPAEVTVRGKRTGAVVLMLVASLLGAGLAAANSKTPDNIDAEVKKRKLYRFLTFLPILSGVLAGLAAGLVVYVDDPTWAASRGADTAKLIIAAFTAATGGLTLTAPPARAAQRQVQKRT